MEEFNRDRMRKLAIWDSKTFTPIITDDELEPIMDTLGFTGLPPLPDSGCAEFLLKEYVYPCAAAAASKLDPSSQAPPRLRLPYPWIDGLHLYSYRAFLGAVTFYLQTCDISHIFHIRAMPLHRRNDGARKWKRMDEGNSAAFVYREGTLDQSTYDRYHIKPGSKGDHDSNVIHDEGNNDPSTSFVPMKDINSMADSLASSSKTADSPTSSSSNTTTSSSSSPSP
ncbi:hypothetical protein CFOL_v3_25273 [Cephalotus follicularis]|uniref:Uncharacterized protein n=1 Tax=Cephalotus follicularis TaxID=3775 RepID=A0A1Q3CNJ2_CEPFO|nr:hypothetical protein CFOL_v3_25273 [Cephalotus follicularis]